MATEPIGLFHYAQSYVNSAVSLSNTKPDCIFPETPVRYLYNHSIELYLKSLLLLNGTPLNELKSKFGHRIDKLTEEAMKQGLTLEDKEIQIINHLSFEVFDHRYIDTGVYSLINLDEIYNVCVSMHNSIGPKIYKKAGISRDIVSLTPLRTES